MTDLMPGLFFLDGKELFNDGRTLANIAAIPAFHQRGFRPTSGFFCTCNWDQNLTLETNAAALAALAACLPACLDTHLNITTNTAPTTPNPWADANDSRAAEFLGFTVEDVTGLDGRHNSRNTTARLAFPKGSVLSPLNPTHRTVTFDLVAWATSPRGLQYGMQWLDYILGTDCAECSLHELVFQTDCSGNTIWRLLEVGLISGPEWGEAITEGFSKYARQVTVSIAAGIPWLFSKPQASSPFFAPGWKAGNVGTPQYAPSVDISGANTIPKLYDWLPIVTIDAPYGHDSYTYNFQVQLANSFDLVDWITTLTLPALSRFVIDSSQRRMFFYPDASDPDVVYDGAGFIDATAGFVQWVEVSCGGYVALQVPLVTAPADGAPPGSDAGRWRVDWVKRQGA